MKLEKKLIIYILILMILAIIGIQIIFFKNAVNVINQTNMYLLIQDHLIDENPIHSLYLEMIIGTIIILIVTILFSFFLAKNIKSQLFGYEPREIADFYKERQLIFDTISDEIITLDHTGTLTKRNSSAKTNIKPEDEIILRQIYNEIAKTKQNFIDREYLLKDRKVFISTLFINVHDDFFDLLFINKSGNQMKKLARDITGVNQIINSMRANVHEFKNKIHVISGLLRLEEYDEAKKYISNIKFELTQENNKVEGINDPIIKALLLTKINLAREKKIKLNINLSSNLMNTHNTIHSDDLIILIGNLVENAMESFELYDIPKKTIKVYLLEDQNKIFIQVSDNGAPIKNIDHIFSLGVSSKGTNRGSGLALIKNLVSMYNGTIDISLENNFKTFSIQLIKGDVQ